MWTVLKAANLERDRRERWAPEMHTAANLAHINAEMDRYVAEQAKSANPCKPRSGSNPVLTALCPCR